MILNIKDAHNAIKKLKMMNPSLGKIIEKQLSDILPEYKQSIKTEEELSHIIDTNEDLRNEIGNLINQRDFKFDSIAELKQESKVKLINVPRI